MAKQNSDKPKLRRSKLHPRHWWDFIRSTKLMTGIFAGVVVLLIIVIGQIVYPVDRALPFARVGGTDVGLSSEADVIERLRAVHGSAPLTITTTGRTDSLKVTTAEAGITPRYQDGARAAASYATWERLIPLSIVWKSATASSIEMPYSVEPERYAAFRTKVAGFCKRDPTNAGLQYRDGQVQLAQAVSGSRCADAAIYASLTRTPLNNGQAIVVEVPAEPNEPVRTNDEVRPLVAAAQDAVSKGLSITSGRSGETWGIPRDNLATWLSVSESDDGALRLALNQEAVEKYLEANIRGRLYIEPGTSVVTYRDGREAARTDGTPGRGVDVDVTVVRIGDALLGGAANRTVTAQITTLPPREEVKREYTASNAGMQALVEQWDRDYPTARFGVIVRDLSGRGLSAQLNPDRDFVTASTFKMFLAYAVLHKSEEGSIGLSDKTSTGLSVKACIEEMILHSTNECALALMNQAGWSYVHNYVRSQFPSTSLDNGANKDNEKHTTPRDAADFMTRLHNTELQMSGDNHSYLIGLFKRQVYRSGIPKGVPGVSVANKVGFYNGWKHDTGIVYAKKGPYVISVLTYGGSDPVIAELSRRVAGLMNQ